MSAEGFGQNLLILCNYLQSDMKRDYFALWSLLAVSLAVITAISCLGGIDLGIINIKSSGLAERLTAAAATAADPDNAVSYPGQGRHTTIPAEVDTAAQRILIIGDSMLEGLNPRLAAYAKENGHTLNSVIWYSSTTEYWGTSDTLGVFLRQFKPTFIFISLGANELFVRDIVKKRDSYVKNFLRQIGNIPYVWIGPPNWKKDTGINDLIAANIPASRFFISNGMSFNRQKDGAHPTHESAAKWMDSIARWMPLHCDHPIRMTRPEAKKSRPDNVVVLQPKR